MLTHAKRSRLTLARRIFNCRIVSPLWLSAMVFGLMIPPLASSAQVRPPLTPDQAILDCHARSVHELSGAEVTATASRRYHAVKTEAGEYRVIGHFIDGEGADAKSLDVECLVAPGAGVVEFTVLSPPSLSGRAALARSLKSLIDAPKSPSDPRLEALSFQEALYLLDDLSRTQIERLHELIYRDAVVVPSNIRAAIDANVSTLTHGRAGGK